MGEKFFPRELVCSTIQPLLTDKEVQILLKIQKGMPNKQIAYEMDIAEPTVKVHISKMFKKLHCYNRIQLVQEAIRKGFLR